MKNKANKLALSVSALVVTFLSAQPDEAWAQLGISELRAPDGSPNPALSVDNNGNVGIGITTPGALFHVNSDASASTVLGAFMEPNLTQGGFCQTYLGRAGAANGCSTFTYTRSAVTPTSSALSLGLYNSSYSLNILGNGNVGIGTIAPTALFHVNSSAANSSVLGAFMEPNLGGGAFNQIYLGRSGSAHGCATVTYTSDANAPANSFLSLGLYNSSYSLNVRGDGSVGIGTTTPQSMLDVAGQIRSTTLLLTSDRNAKANFLPVNSREILGKLVALPLTTWHYTNAPGVRHLGPMAQDFQAAFPELGEDDKHIATVDADGVALASIQALYEMVQTKDSQIAALEQQVSALRTELAGVKNSVADRLAALEKATAGVQQASLRPEAAAR